ncbi:MAG: regulatory iron-sulfur-containing complex subunit RicT [bacterium]
MNNIYTIKYNGDLQTVLVCEEKFSIGEEIVVKIEKAKQLCTVERICPKVKEIESNTLFIRKVEKEDRRKNEKNIIDCKRVTINAKKIAEELKLNIVLISSCYSLDRKQLYIVFSADARIDFREYAKRLGQVNKTRVELKQIGARDRSKMSSGIGACGQKLCCSRHLKNMDTVTIFMAKNQNLALNPSKINGCCGRLKCCLGYENDNYKENRDTLPSVGDKIIYNEKEETIRSIDILRRKIYIFVDRVKVELDADEYNKE